MINILRLIIVTFVLSNISLTVYGAKVKVYVESTEFTTNSLSTNPRVKLLTSGDYADQQQDTPDEWIFPVKIGDELITPMLIDLDGEIPTSFKFNALKLEAPLQR